MKKQILLAGTVSLESLLGCGYTEFPQFSSRCALQDISYSDPSFMGEKQMPPALNIVDRMEYVGLHWNHQLKFEFISNSSEQANGTFAVGLDNVTRIDQGVWPNDWYDGTGIHQEPKVHGTGAWCNYQYLYFLYLESIPPVTLLQEVYPGYESYVGKDPTTHMDLYTSLPHPEEVEFDDTEWNNAIEENEGITLYFTFTRHLRSELPGGEGYKDCILPTDQRGTESLTFTYHAPPEDLDDQTDIRKESMVEGIEESLPPVIFFRQIVPDIK